MPAVSLNSQAWAEFTRLRALDNPPPPVLGWQNIQQWIDYLKEVIDA